MARSLYTELTDDLFIDLSNYIANEKKRYSLDEYNITQKIMVNLLNESNLKEIYGDRYSLVIYQDIYAIKDAVQQQNLIFAYSDSSDFNEKLAQQYSDTISMVTEIITADTSKYRDRYLDFNKNSKLINEQLHIDELKLYKNFIESVEGNIYKNGLSRKTSIKELLKEKLNEEHKNEFSVKINQNFDIHFNEVVENIPNFYSDFKDSQYVKKIMNNIRNDFALNSVILNGIEEYSNDMTFCIFKSNDKFIGGTTIHNENNNLYNIFNVDIFNKYKDENNVEEIMLKLFEVFPKDSSFLCYIKNEEDPILYKVLEKIKIETDCKIYMNESELNAINELTYALEKSSLSDKAKQNIINKHYDEVINKLIIPSWQDGKKVNEYNSLKNKQFIDGNIKETSLINIQNINRNEFCNYILINKDEEQFKNKVIYNSLSNFKNAFTISEIENTPNIKNFNKLFDEIKTSLSGMKVKLPINTERKLLKDIQDNYIYNKIDNEMHYNYHNLYDFLCEEKLIKQKSKTTIYRLEINNAGIYRSEDSIIKNDREINYIKNLYDRRRPEKEINLAGIFSDHYYGNAEKEYKKNWFFGFSDKDQILKWFDQKEIAKFNESGIKLVRYEVDENYLINTNRQVAFIKEKARKVNEIELTTLLNNEKEQQLSVNPLKIKNSI